MMLNCCIRAVGRGVVTEVDGKRTGPEPRATVRNLEGRAKENKKPTGTFMSLFFKPLFHLSWMKC